VCALFSKNEGPQYLLLEVTDPEEEPITSLALTGAFPRCRQTRSNPVISEWPVTRANANGPHARFLQCIALGIETEGRNNEGKQNQAHTIKCGGVY
jgi:hypothetical protein